MMLNKPINANAQLEISVGVLVRLGLLGRRRGAIGQIDATIAMCGLRQEDAPGDSASTRAQAFLCTILVL